MAAAAPAQAAKRRVPFGFSGVVGLDRSVSDTILDSQLALMARSGVESVRVSFWWDALNPRPNAFDFSSTDRLVASYARHGLAILANISRTPQWASSLPSSDSYPFFYSYAPRSPQLFADFMTALVRRYGPHGTFWKVNPGLRRDPIRHWQIWNEERIFTFWASQPWAPTYTRLLRAAYLAIHHADHGAKVVAGSLAAVGGSAQWDQAEDLYRAGAKRYFDELSVHAFTTAVRVPVSQSIDHMALIFRLVRDVMKRHGDGRKYIIDTELTWPAAVGFIPSKRLLGLETTPRGERSRLTAAYNYLATHMRQTGVVQAYWYVWASDFDPNSPNRSYDFAGLVRAFADGRFVPQPVLRTYTQVAARYEGCRKSSNARVCY